MAPHGQVRLQQDAEGRIKAPQTLSSPVFHFYTIPGTGVDL